jgi:hypothetical protein
MGSITPGRHQAAGSMGKEKDQDHAFKEKTRMTGWEVLIAGGISCKIIVANFRFWEFLNIETWVREHENIG